MKDELTFPLVEDQLMIITIISMIINYHPGGAKQLKYVSSLILPTTDKLAYLSPYYMRRMRREVKLIRQYKIEEGFRPRCN